MTPKWALPLAGINVALSIVIGAFGAHSLREKVPAESMVIFHTGAQYHQIQAIGALLILLLLDRCTMPKRAFAGFALILVGCLLFSGSLYALAATGTRMLGMITPFGGVAFITGWLLVAFSGLVPTEQA